MVAIYFSSEGFANYTPGHNPFVDLLSPMSPFTYSVETMMRSLLSQVNGNEKVFDYFHMKRSDVNCVAGVLLITFGYFSISWLVTVLKSRIIF